MARLKNCSSSFLVILQRGEFVVPVVCGRFCGHTTGMCLKSNRIGRRCGRVGNWFTEEIAVMRFWTMLGLERGCLGNHGCGV